MLSLGLLNVNRQPPLYLEFDLSEFNACNDSAILNKTLPRLLFSLPTYVTSSFGGEVGRPPFFIYELSNGDLGADAIHNCWKQTSGNVTLIQNCSQDSHVSKAIWLDAVRVLDFADLGAVCFGVVRPWAHATSGCSGVCTFGCLGARCNE